MEAIPLNLTQRRWAIGGLLLGLLLLASACAPPAAPPTVSPSPTESASISPPPYPPPPVIPTEPPYPLPPTSPPGTPPPAPNGITSPEYNLVVQGQVQIIGTAAHPQFLRYELFYGPCPVSDAEWCGIGDAVFQQVQNGLLGVWNTTAIPDGTYSIQLRVTKQDGSYESFIVHGITVANTQPPTATPTSPPTIIPPIHTPVDGQLPRITHDLLFLGKYSLMRWNHTTGQIEALATPEAEQREGGQRDQTVAWSAGRGGPDRSVSSFSVSADGQKIALVRSSPPENYEIELLDLVTHQVTSLARSQGQSLSRMAISPDGKWVAYIQTGSLPAIPPPSGGAKSGLAVPPARPAAGGGTTAGVISAVQADAPDRRIEVGYCAEEHTQEYWWQCLGFLWSPDSRSIAWSDGRGVWLAELGQPARQLTTNTMGMPPNGVHGVFEARAWSPVGRYLLAWIGYYEGSSQGVIDSQTRRIADLPAAFEYAYTGARVSWTQDGRLFVTRPGSKFGGNGPSVEIWRVDGNRDPMLECEVVIPLGVGPENIPAAPTQLADGRLALALLNGSATNYQERGLYLVDLSDRVPHKVTGLPPIEERDSSIGGANVLWSPDSSGAIFEYLGFDIGNHVLLYVPADGSPLTDLSPVMDEGQFQACCFVWAK